jgi:tetratricopeptide (TPR) repeat protein
MEAEAAFREAIRLKADYHEGHYDLGNALVGQHRLKEAEKAFREAIRIKPDFPAGHLNLGTVLYAQGRFKESEAAYREAVRLKPNDPLPHCNVGLALQKQGRFADALEALRRGHALGTRTPGWRYPSADWARRCERHLTLDRDLSAFLRGEKVPASAAERLEVAELCRQYKRLHFAAAHLAAAAFTADPKLAADLRPQHRYNAACSAALAAAGNAEDARGLAVEEWAWLQQRAHDWLRADLTAYTQFVEKGDPATRSVIQKRLAHWQSDADLLAVRDPAWLAAMPAPDRVQWQQLWADVAALQKKAAAKSER